MVPPSTPPPQKKKCPHPNSRNPWMWSYLEKCFWRSNQVRDLEMRIAFWITWVVLKQITSVLKRKGEIWVRHKGEDIDRGRRHCDHRQRSEWFSCKSRSAKNHQKLEEAKDRFSPRDSRGSAARNTGNVDFWPPELWEQISLVLSHPVCGHLLGQPQETNTLGFVLWFHLVMMPMHFCPCRTVTFSGPWVASKSAWAAVTEHHKLSVKQQTFVFHSFGGLEI